MSWSVDGITWDYPCTIQRVAEVTPSEISGMMLDKTYFNDVIGTYLRYTVAIAVPKDREEDYTLIYEMLTNPQNYHSFVLPYNETEISINARVQVVSDQWVRLPGNKQTWRKTTFEIISNTPTKVSNETGSTEMYGTTPYPDDPQAQVGDIYEYTQAGWIMRNYENGDGIAY